MREVGSWRADQLCNYPGSESGLGVDLPQHLPHLCSAGAHEGMSPEDSKLQDVHNNGITKRSSNEGQAKTRGLKPDK